MSWPMVALGEAAEIVRGVTFAKADASSQELPSHVPVLRAGNIAASLNTVSDLVWLDRSKVSEKQLLQFGDIVMCTSSGSASVLGKSASLEKEWVGTFGAFCAGIRAKRKKVDPRFLAHYLAAPKFRTWASTSSGANIKNIRASELKAYEIPLPPLDEQKRIAAILDKADALRRARDRAVSILDSYVQALFYATFGDPVTNEKGYPVSELREAIAPARPITYGILKPGPDVPDGVPYVRVVDMADGEIRTSRLRRTSPEIAAQYRRSTIRTGDLLISIRGHVGRLAHARAEHDGANITQDTARLALAGVLPEFAKAALETPSAQHWMFQRTKGAAVKGINLGDLKQFPLILPPPAAQARFSNRLRRVHQIRTGLARASQRAVDLFTALQHRAFAGEL